MEIMKTEAIERAKLLKLRVQRPIYPSFSFGIQEAHCSSNSINQRLMYSLIRDGRSTNFRLIRSIMMPCEEPQDPNGYKISKEVNGCRMLSSSKKTMRISLLIESFWRS